MSNRVQNKVAVITGGAQGIGYGCAEMLAREGAKVVIGDKNAERGAAAAAQIRAAGGQAHFHPFDALFEEQCAGLIAAAVQQYGRLDVLVNNVGYPRRATLEETDAKVWDLYMNLNVRGAFFCSKHAIPRMKANGLREPDGEPHGGSIINIGSIHGIQAGSNLIAYGAAKGALLTLTRTLAGQHTRDRIRANYIIPGWVLSEGELEIHADTGVSEENLRERGKNLTFGRHQTPQDTAYAVVYLASNESSQVTGTIMHIDAGNSTLPFRGQ